MDMIEDLEKRINGGYRLSYEQAIEFADNTSTEELCELASRLRECFHGKYFDTCSIMNARSGRCSEDCKWCSQSKYHKTDIDIYPLVELKETVELAQHNAHKGVKRFSLVTSGRTMSESEMKKICSIYQQLAKEVDINLCASLGLLSKEQLVELRASGVERYHCNLESAPSYFPELCTTHTTAEKIQTLTWAKEAGLQVCSGGIIGMGETMHQRIELAETLRKIGVNSIPVNVLNPIKGTALENTPPLSDDEILKTIAMFCIINPDATIRLAGGRCVVKHLETSLLHCGVSAAIVGDMLTTNGSDIETDKALFRKEGFVTE